MLWIAGCSAFCDAAAPSQGIALRNVRDTPPSHTHSTLRVRVSVCTSRASRQDRAWASVAVARHNGLLALKAPLEPADTVRRCQYGRAATGSRRRAVVFGGDPIQLSWEHRHEVRQAVATFRWRFVHGVGRRESCSALTMLLAGSDPSHRCVRACDGPTADPTERTPPVEVRCEHSPLLVSQKWINYKDLKQIIKKLPHAPDSGPGVVSLAEVLREFDILWRCDLCP